MNDTVDHRKIGFYTAIFVPLVFVGLMWAVFLISEELQFPISQYGLFPRKMDGLIGLITMPVIHGSFSHLINNSAPMLILGWMLFRFYPTLAWRTLLQIWFIAGIWLWISGRASYHIGASGIVYGLAAFLFLSGWLRREKRVAALSFIVVFLYGGMWWGVLPVDPSISWEGHLWGGIAGFALAIYYRKLGPQRPLYKWEIEDDADEEEMSVDELTSSPPPPTPDSGAQNIVYTFKPSVPPNKKFEG